MTADYLNELAARLDERSAPQQPLTPRQKEVLDYLRAFIKDQGYAPSLEEIGEVLGLSSLATVYKHLENLKAKGYVARQWNLSRSLILLDPAPTGVTAEAARVLRQIAIGLQAKVNISLEAGDLP